MPDRNRVLVVDDNEIGVKLTRAILQASGYIVDVAYTAEEGLTLLADNEHALPDLILLDLDLPGMPGLEFCTRLRQSGCAIPILVFTAYGASEGKWAKLCFEAGANGFVEKTGEIDLLPRYVDLYLGESPRARAGDLAPKPEPR